MRDSAALMKNNPMNFQTGCDWWWFCVFFCSFYQAPQEVKLLQKHHRRSVKVTALTGWVKTCQHCHMCEPECPLCWDFLLPLIVRHFGHGLSLLICALEIRWTWIEWVKVVKSSTSLNCCFSCVFRFQRSSTPRSAMPSVSCRGQRSPSSRSGPDTQMPVNLLLCVLKTHPDHFFLALCLGWKHDQFHQRGNQSEEQLPDVQVSILKPRISSFPSKTCCVLFQVFSNATPIFF